MVPARKTMTSWTDNQGLDIPASLNVVWVSSTPGVVLSFVFLPEVSKSFLNLLWGLLTSTTTTKYKERNSLSIFNQTKFLVMTKTSIGRSKMIWSRARRSKDDLKKFNEKKAKYLLSSNTWTSLRSLINGVWTCLGSEVYSDTDQQWAQEKKIIFKCSFMVVGSWTLTSEDQQLQDV